MKKWEYLIVNHQVEYNHEDGSRDIRIYANNQSLKEERTETRKINWRRTESFTVKEYPSDLELIDFGIFNYFGERGWELMSIEKIQDENEYDGDSSYRVEVDEKYYFKRPK